MITLEDIKREGYTSVGETSKAYYIIPDTQSRYVSFVYRIDKETKEIEEKSIMDSPKDFPDFFDEEIRKLEGLPIL